MKSWASLKFLPPGRWMRGLRAMREHNLRASTCQLGSLTPMRFGDIEGAIYVRNYDGDTITVNLPGMHPLFGNNISVRLAGIDTPEKNGKCEREKMLAKEVKNVVAAALAGARKIVLADVARDKYFRINARVLADDVDIDAMLIERGLAVPYDGGTKTHNWCAPK